MTVLLAPQGGTISIVQGAQSVAITLPEPAELYYFFAQSAQPNNVYQQSLAGDQFIAGLQAPAGASDVLSYLAVDRNDTNVSAITVTADETYVTLPVSLQDYAVVVMPTWNTSTWFSSVTDTTTQINFAVTPGVDAFLYYYYVPLSNTAVTEDIQQGVMNATVPILNSPGLVPFVLVNWNTSLGVTPLPETGAAFLQFSVPAPANAMVYYFVQYIPAPLPAPIQPIVPMQQPFVISDLTAQQFVARFSNLFPYPWRADTAVQPGGILYALFFAFAYQLTYINAQLIYAWQLCRLDTIPDIAGLTIFSEDFFGDALPPLGGESVDHYRQRISAALFQPKVTRPAIVADIESYTGGLVRPIEPWNPGDTGSWGTSYWDFDTEEVPSLYGDPSERYQGYLQVQLPSAVQAGLNIWGIDKGAGWDIETGTWWEVFENFVSQEAQVLTFIAGIIAQGTTAWVKFVNGFIYPVTTGAAMQIASSITTLNINLPNLAGLYGLFAQLSLAMPIWITGTTYEGFTVEFLAPTSTGTWLSYLALEVGNSNLNVTSVSSGQTTITLDVDASANSVIPMAYWETTVYYTSRSDSAVTFEFAIPAPASEVFNYMVVPINPNVGTQPVPGLATGLTIVVTIDPYHVPFAVANWNTNVGVLPDPANGTIDLTFSNPAPSGGGEVMFVNYQVNS